MHFIQSGPRTARDRNRFELSVAYMYSLWLVKDNPPTCCDCFVVLSYAVENKDVPTRPTQAIIDLAKRWHTRFPNAKIIMSTGDNQKLGVPNSRVMKKYATRIGIPSSVLVEEYTSIDTYTNLKYSYALAKKLQCSHITLVMYDLHVKRSLATARRMGFKNIHWVSVGAKGSPAYGIKRFQTHSRTSIYVYEVFAYIYYAWKSLV